MERKVHRATVIKVGKHQLQRSKEVKSQQINLKRQAKEEDRQTIEAQVLENFRQDQERQRRRFHTQCQVNKELATMVERKRKVQSALRSTYKSGPTSIFDLLNFGHSYGNQL